MGLLLREALKTLCGKSQWCYAVFWKIGCQNPKLLIWEDCHYESVPCSVLPRVSGIESSDMPFGEWEGCWGSSELCSSLPGIQERDKVYLLVNKMMMNNQVNVLGEGLVGRAAFTGNHQWILANSYIGGAHPPEVLNEVHHQFSAGMQTVAVIPVLPHGVIQLGSTWLIMENMGFVNDVKSLILRLGCVSGALLSDNYTVKESAENVGMPVPLGMPVSVDPTRNHKLTNPFPSMTGSHNHEGNSSQASGLVGHPSCSQIRHIQDNPETSASTFQNCNLTQTLARPSGDHCEAKLTSAMKPDITLRGKLENVVVGAEVIPSNPIAWLNQHVASYNLRSGFNTQPIGQSSASHGGHMMMEQHILTGAGVQNHVHNKMNGALMVNSHDRSSATGNVMSGHLKPISISCPSNPLKPVGISVSSTLTEVGLQNIYSSGMEEVPSSGLVDQLSTSEMLSQGCGQMYPPINVRQIKNESNLIKERMDNDLFQVLNNPLNQPVEHMPEQVPGFANHCLKNESGYQRTSTKYEDACARTSTGNDLFDILGVNFKNKLFNGQWNNLLVSGPDGMTQHLDKDTSAFVNAQDLSSDFYSVNEGVSDSDIFSALGTDHLLDAVVSRAHSAAKQSSDDNLSCRTTVTSISSSIPSSYPPCGRVSMSDKFQGELFGLPKTLGKAGTLGPSSFRSGCGKDDVGSCSQTTTSIYGSQISSLVEQGQNMKRDNSVSTAFSKRNDEMSKPNRKRLKPGENPRPRPKDRQMIQDRVKELREIVPNGAKCSIDALLERTIKHMLFLQSVTKHADKLKQTGESKIINKEGGLLLKENFEGGATWAFEVGSQSMVCPIIVEDLNAPRQMLVEMLCEERGFFLEIADLIRGLGLTILKGVMEARNDKIWAQFAVEANRDVTRMEIFMALVRLLEQTLKGSTSAANLLDNNIVVSHAFPQASSIPATGRPVSLQ